MEEAFIVEYLKSERFKKFLEKTKVNVMFYDNYLLVFFKENDPRFNEDDHIQYNLCNNTDTLKYSFSYQIEGVENIAKEIEYPDELRAMIKYVSENGK